MSGPNDKSQNSQKQAPPCREGDKTANGLGYNEAHKLESYYNWHYRAYFLLIYTIASVINICLMVIVIGSSTVVDNGVSFGQRMGKPSLNSASAPMSQTKSSNQTDAKSDTPSLPPKPKAHGQKPGDEGIKKTEDTAAISSFADMIRYIGRIEYFFMYFLIYYLLFMVFGALRKYLLLTRRLAFLSDRMSTWTIVKIGGIPTLVLFGLAIFIFKKSTIAPEMKFFSTIIIVFLISGVMSIWILHLRDYQDTVEFFDSFSLSENDIEKMFKFEVGKEKLIHNYFARLQKHEGSGKWERKDFLSRFGIAIYLISPFLLIQLSRFYLFKYAPEIIKKSKEQNGEANEEEQSDETRKTLIRASLIRFGWNARGLDVEFDMKYYYGKSMTSARVYMTMNPNGEPLKFYAEQDKKTRVGL